MEWILYQVDDPPNGDPGPAEPLLVNCAKDARFGRTPKKAT